MYSVRNIFAAIAFYLYVSINFTFSQDTNLNLLKEFAKKDIAWAQYELSNLYYQGSTVTKSKDLAFQYMLASAKQGYNKAAYGLGVYYNLGVGCTPNKIQSLAWMQKSLDSGYLRAQSYINQLSQSLELESIEEANQLLKRTLTVTVHPKWVYINSTDNKIKTNSQGSDQVFLESYLYSKKSITFSKSGYNSQVINVEFGKNLDLTINLLSNSVDLSKSSSSNGTTSSSKTITSTKTSDSTDWIYY